MNCVLNGPATHVGSFSSAYFCATILRVRIVQPFPSDTAEVVRARGGRSVVRWKKKDHDKDVCNSGIVCRQSLTDCLHAIPELDLVS